jgi:hypothetical protein
MQFNQLQKLRKQEINRCLYLPADNRIASTKAFYWEILLFVVKKHILVEYFVFYRTLFSKTVTCFHLK